MPLVEKRRFTDEWVSSDANFNKLYPAPIKALSAKHWTPLSVARKAASFLATENNVKILDIGSGVGKFCLSAASFQPSAVYYGVEQRRNLINYAEKAKELLQQDNVFFIHGNFTKLDFSEYDHFYFFNSFYENLHGTVKIDESIAYSAELYNYYNRYLYRQLAARPAGTRLATFHSLEDEVPHDYHIVGTDMNNLLKFWIKI